MKEAQQIPGAFPKSLPYATPGRLRRALGLPNVGKKGGGFDATGTVGKPMGTVNMGAQGTVTKMGAGSIGTTPVTMKQHLGGGPVVKPRMRISQPPKPIMVRHASAYPTIEDAEEALGFGEDRELRSLLTKEGSANRLREVIATVEILESTDDIRIKTAAVARLAELRKEALIGGILRKGLGMLGGAAKTIGLRRGLIGAGVGGGAYGAYKLISGAGRKLEDIGKQREQRVMTPGRIQSR